MNKKILAIILVIIATFFATLMGMFLKIAQEEINVFIHVWWAKYIIL